MPNNLQPTPQWLLKHGCEVYLKLLKLTATKTR